MHALPAAASRASLHPRVRGHRQRRFGEHGIDLRRATALRARATSAAIPASISASSIGVGGEHLAGVQPQRVDRRLHPRVRLVGAVAQPDHPVARALDVIRDLLRALGGDVGDARVARARQRPQREQVPCVEQELARDRVGVVAVRLLDEQQVAEFVAVAEERELVLGAAAAADPRLDFAGIARATAAPAREDRARRWSSAMSSSSTGPLPTHSPSRCARTSGESPSRSRYSNSCRSLVMSVPPGRPKGLHSPPPGKASEARIGVVHRCFTSSGIGKNVGCR